MFIIYPNAKNFPFWVLLFKTISSSPVMCEVNWSKQTNACMLYEHSRAEGYSQCEIDYLFKTLVISTITFGLSVYGSSPAKLSNHITRVHAQVTCFQNQVSFKPGLHCAQFLVRHG